MLKRRRCMKSQSTFKLRVAPNGTILAIYDDALWDVFPDASMEITRASLVEPTPSGRWIADMSPAIKQFNLDVDNPILGPFTTRAAALKAEHEWLEKRLFA
jgi:hypothetical protein